MDIVIKDLDKDDEKAKIHVDKLLSVAMNTQHYFDVRSLIDKETTDENGFIDIEKLLDKAEEVSPYRKANLVYEVTQMIKKLGVPLDKNMTDEKQKLYDNITKTFTHKDGRTYNILSLNGNDYLLQNQKTGDYIIANSLDVNSKEWSFGNYYSNTSKDLALASFDFAKKTDETVVNVLLEKISHKELFFGVANLEDDRWKELSQQQKETIYDTYMNDDIYTSILDQHILEQVDNTFESKNNIKEDFVMETKKEYGDKTHYMKKAVIEGNLVWKSELENKTTAKGCDSKFVKALVNCYDRGGKKTFSLVAWDEMAEQLSTVEKNQKISIIAYPRYTEYEKDGKKHDSEQYVVQAIDRDNQISKQIDMLLNDYCKGRISQIYENPAHEYGASIDYSNEMGTVKSQGISKDHDEELER